MDFLKGLSFAIIAFIIGAIFLLLGILGGIPLGANSNLTIQSVGIRIVLDVVGAVFVCLGFYAEFKQKGVPLLLTGQFGKPAKTDVKELSAERFFSTLDDPAVANFSLMAQGAQRISILGRTAVNLLSQYQREFERLGSTGCSIRLLFVDPLCEASRYVYGNTPHVYWNNINIASTHLRTIQEKLGSQLQVKTTKHAPTLSVIIVEKQPIGESFARVQLYFLHSRVGRDRPVFQVNHSDRWYNVFVEEFNQIWAAGEGWDDSCLTRAVAK